MPKRWIVGISGASGTIYGRRLVQALIQHQPELFLDVVITEGASRVMKEEENLNAKSAVEIFGLDSPRIQLHNNRDSGAAVASGSHVVDGMVIVPCSMNTLAAVATGIADNLLRRVADVTIKEGRKLIIVPRETPLSRIHLENLLKLSQMGVAVVPAMPGFYSNPQTISDLVEMMVMRIADQMQIHLPLVERWKQTADHERP